MAEKTDRPQVSGKTAPPQPKRRGRPPGSKNTTETPTEKPIGPDSAPRRGRPKKPHIELDPEAIARQVRGIHGFIAMITGLPELNLSEAESIELAKASVNFSREFGWEPDPKVLAGIELFGVASFIYLPRFLHIAQRIKAQRAQQAQTIDGEATAVETPDNGQSAVN